MISVSTMMGVPHPWPSKRLTGLWPGPVACSILVSRNQLLDMIHARVDWDCNGQRTVINDGNWAQQWRHNEFSCNQYQSWAHILMTSWACGPFHEETAVLQLTMKLIMHSISFYEVLTLLYHKMKSKSNIKEMVLLWSLVIY